MKGWGKFTGENTVAVDGANGTEEIQVKNVLIATGSEPSSLPPGILDIDEKYVVTSTGALDLKKIPKKMVLLDLKWDQYMQDSELKSQLSNTLTESAHSW